LAVKYRRVTIVPDIGDVVRSREWTEMGMRLLLSGVKPDGEMLKLASELLAN
jgi:hypothetical protein